MVVIIIIYTSALKSRIHRWRPNFVTVFSKQRLVYQYTAKN